MSMDELEINLLDRIFLIFLRNIVAVFEEVVGVYADRDDIALLHEACGVLEVGLQTLQE